MLKFMKNKFSHFLCNFCLARIFFQHDVVELVVWAGIAVANNFSHMYSSINLFMYMLTAGPGNHYWCCTILEALDFDRWCSIFLFHWQLPHSRVLMYPTLPFFMFSRAFLLVHTLAFHCQLLLVLWHRLWPKVFLFVHCLLLLCFIEKSLQNY